MNTIHLSVQSQSLFAVTVSAPIQDNIVMSIEMDNIVGYTSKIIHKSGIKERPVLIYTGGIICNCEGCASVP